MAASARRSNFLPRPEGMRRLLSRFAGRKVLVVGDAIADQYVFGEPVRISREAPVLILRHRGGQLLPGGAANAANNVGALGGEAHLLGVVGTDATARELQAVLASCGVGCTLVADPSRPTTVKTRVVAGGRQAVKQQVVRVDRYVEDPLSPAVEAQVIHALRQLGEQAEAIIVSDYGNGVVTPAVIEAAREVGSRRGIPVAADSRYQLLRFSSVSVATPNVIEVEESLGRRVSGDALVVEAGRELLARLGFGLGLVITRGEEGMTLLDASGEAVHVRAYQPREVFDVTGAGDTVIAALTLGLAAGGRLLEAAVLANLAAGLVVGKVGVATAGRAELLRALAHYRPDLIPVGLGAAEA